MNSKDKSSEQRFGHVNAINRNSYLNIIFIKLVTQYASVKNYLKKQKLGLWGFRFQKTGF